MDKTKTKEKTDPRTKKIKELVDSLSHSHDREIEKDSQIVDLRRDITRLQKQIRELVDDRITTSEMISDLKQINTRLVNRSFWQRVFNYD